MPPTNSLRSFIVLILLLFLILMVPSTTLAYIGPGAGISVLGSLLGILGTIVIAVSAILFWPIRKVIRRRKQAGLATQNRNSPSGD